MLRGAVTVKDTALALLRAGGRTIQAPRRLMLKLIVLPGYKQYLVVKKIAKKFYAPHLIRHKLIHPFSRRYLVHVVIIAIAGFTIASNLNAYEVRLDDIQRTSVMAKLVATEDLGGIVEEQGPITESRKVTRYLGQTGVASKPRVAEGDDETALSTTAGGSALVRQILSPVEEGRRQRDEITYYTVQPGDTVSDIASQFGVTVNTLLWENNLTAYNVIRPGDKLAILPTSGIRHKVTSGDTLAKIAKQYDVDQEKIIDANKLASANDLHVGEELLIPGGKKPAPPPLPTYAIRRILAPQPVGRVVTGSGAMSWPNGCRRITQYYSWRHSGVDIACEYGQTIHAADAGTVITATSGWNGGYGTYIIINHGNGTQTLYGHLSKLYVSVGDEVEKGESIGAEGSTGRSTGPHLHFEVRAGGVRRNPFSYVK